jgi:hypothetical protein
MTKFNQLLSRHIASSLLKQQALGSFLGEHSWSANLESGQVDFGRGRTYPLQILGSESEVSDTWLWGWANEESGIPDGVLVCARQLQAFGTKHGIAELLQPEISLTEVDGHQFALVASGLSKASAYYRGPHKEGAVFFTMQNVPLQQHLQQSPVELINIMSGIISQFPVDHRIMARSFLQDQGLIIAGTDQELVATAPNDDEITIRFDELGRIAGMSTTAVPQRQTANDKKPWWRRGN